MQTNTQNNADRVSAKVNAKKTKTWKIVEYCACVVIRAKVNGSAFKIDIIEWDTGLIIDTFVGSSLHEYRLDMFLLNVTTPYYTGKVIEWIKANVWGNK